MKIWKILLVVALCSGLLGAWGLIGCGGDDDCEKACDRCAPEWADCSDQCDECGVGDCNINADCGALTLCILSNCD